MKRQIVLLCTLAVGIGIGTLLTHGLQAQTKPKVYLMSEFEPLDKAASEAYNKAAVALVKEHGGRATGVAVGKITPIVGEAPKGVTLTEWDTVEQVQAFLKAPDYVKLRPEQDKGRKTIRSFIVEAGQLP
jgi:uncharacterized protein (DUF1330 family)